MRQSSQAQCCVPCTPCGDTGPVGACDGALATEDGDALTTEAGDCLTPETD